MMALEAGGTEAQVVLLMMGQEELGTLAQVVPHMMVLVGHVIRGQVAHVIQILEAQALTVLMIVDKRCTKYKHLTIASTLIVKARCIRNAKVGSSILLRSTNIIIDEWH